MTDIFNSIIENFSDRKLSFWHYNECDENGLPAKENRKEEFITLLLGKGYDDQNLSELLELLHKIIMYSNNSDRFSTFYTSYWEFVDLDRDRDTDQLLKDLGLFLQSFESHLKPILFITHGDSLLEEISAENKGTGYILSRLGMFSKAGTEKDMYETILYLRNGVVHKNSDKDDLTKKHVKYALPTKKKGMEDSIGLCLCGLLRIIHKNRSKIETFLEEHKDSLVIKDSSPAASFNFNSFIESYVSNLQEYTESRLTEKVGKIGGLANSDNFLMTLQLGRESAIIDFDDEEQDEEASHKEKDEFPMGDLKNEDAERICIILGNPGAGKTTILQSLILDHCEEFKEDSQAAIPLLLNLNEIRSNAYNIEEHILNAVKDKCTFRDSDRETLLDELGRRKITFYIDGINEVHIENPGTFITHLKDFVSKRDNCRFYLTGRKYEFASYREIFSNLKNCGIFEVKEISATQREEFLLSLGMSSESITEFEKKIEETDISHLLGTPLNFKMIADVFIRNKDEMSISNRGELLESFIHSTLADKKNTDNEARAAALLRHIAKLMYNGNSSSGIKESTISLAGYSHNEVTSILSDMHHLNIINRKDIITDYEISFFIDTYYEYFLAKELIGEFIDGTLCFGKQGTSGTSINLNDNNNLETLKLMVEIINHNKSKGTKYGRDFVMRIMRAGQTGCPDSLNSHLELLVTIVLGIKANSQSDNPNARLTVEKLILNYLIYYRCNHTHDCPTDQKYLELLFKWATQMSSGPIYREMFSLYWLAKTGLLETTDINIDKSARLKGYYKVLGQINENVLDLCPLYDVLQNVYIDILNIWPKSAQNMKNFIQRVLNSGTSDAKKKLYRHITEKAARSKYKEVLLNDANILLLMIKDMKYVRMFNPEEVIGLIYWLPVKSLLNMPDKKGLPEFIFSDTFIKKLAFQETILLYMVRYFLFRGQIPQALGDLLFGQEPKILKYINENDYRMLLDIIPAARIPKEIAARYYDEEVHRFVTAKMRRNQEESYEALLFSHFHSDKETFTISIKNITSSFEGKKALFSVDGISYDFQIMEDKWELALRNDFKLTSIDGTAIPESGIIVMGDGKEYEYVTIASNKDVHIQVFDPEMAASLSEAAEQNETVNINGISCKIKTTYRDSRFNRYRTLKIQKRSDVKLNCLSGEVRFAESKRSSLMPVRLNKLLRQEELRNDRKRFRTLSSGYIRSRSWDYAIIGFHNRSAWITCDPIAEEFGMRGRNILLKESTGMGETTTAEVIYTGNYCFGLIELTLRCKLRPDIRKAGKFSVVYPDNTVTYDYIYSFTSHKTVTLRINDPEFIRKEHMDRLITQCRKHEVHFQIADLDLTFENLEVLDTENLYCLGVTIKTPAATLPANGLARLDDDSMVTFKSEYRKPDPTLNGISSAIIYPDKDQAVFFLSDDTVRPYCCHYISIGESPLHLKITGEPVRLPWTASMNLGLDIEWPESSGTICFDSIAGKTFHFQHSGGDNIWIWPDSDSVTFEKFCTGVGCAYDSEIKTEKGTYRCCLQQRTIPEVDDIRNYLLYTDFPSRDPEDIQAWSTLEDDKVLITRSNSINNKKTKVNIVDFKPSVINYTKSGNLMEIIKPSMPVIGLWVEVDKGKRFKIVASEDVHENTDYVRLDLRDSNNLAPNLRDKGTIRFYAKESGDQTIKVGFRNIFNMILWEKPERYHADICSILADELIESKSAITTVVIDFFKTRSRSSMLIFNPVLFRKTKDALEKLNNNNMVFNVCKVITSANEIQLSAMSLMQEGIISSSDTDPVLADHKYVSGDFILYEKNHKIHFIEKPERHTSLGFFNGVVIRILKDGNCFLRALETSEDFYCAERLELGDKVQFFSSYNALDKISKNKKMATDLDLDNIERVKTQKAVITSIENLTEYNIEIIRINTSVASNNNTGRQEFHCFSISKESREWDIVSTWKVGDHIECYRCNRDIFLIY